MEMMEERDRLGICDGEKTNRGSVHEDAATSGGVRGLAEDSRDIIGCRGLGHSSSSENSFKGVAVGVVWDIVMNVGIS